MATPSSSANYKQPDIDRLLEKLADVLLLGGNDWKRVTVSYNVNRPTNIPERDQESLKRKFKGSASVEFNPKLPIL